MFIVMTRKITYASARQKGKTLEYDVRDGLKRIGIDAVRVPMSGALSWLKGDVREFGLIASHVHECKNHQVLCIPEWWRQTIVQIKDDEIPVLHFTSNYKPIYTMLRSQDFDNLVFCYESKRPELSLNLIDVAPRKNFWKVALPDKFNTYLYTTDGEELVAILFEFYLMLRKHSLNTQSP